MRVRPRALITLMLAGVLAMSPSAAIAETRILWRDDADFARRLVPRYMGTAADVVVSPDGHVWVADATENLVRGYGPDGLPTQTIHGAGPVGVAVEASGTLLTAEFGTGRVRRWSSDGRTLIGDVYLGSATRSLGLLPCGDLIVTLSGNTAMIRLTPEGDTVLSWSFEGDFDVSYPFGVSGDSQGNIYVACTSPSTIRRIAPDGTVSVWDSAHVGVGLIFPRDVLVVNDHILLADKGRGEILLLDKNGRHVETIIGGLAEPTGLALGPGDTLYVTEAPGRVNQYTLSGERIRFWGATPGHPAFWDEVSHLELDGDHLWVGAPVHFSASTYLQVFDRNGLHMAHPRNPGMFELKHLATGGGYAYTGGPNDIWTYDNVVRFSGFTTAQDWLSVPSDPVALAADSAGNLYVATSDRQIRVQRPDGSPAGTIGGPGDSVGRFRSAITHMTFGRSNELHVVEASGRLQVFNRQGEYLRGWNLIRGGATVVPADVTVAANGEVLVLDALTAHLLRYASNGTLIGSTTFPLLGCVAIEVDGDNVYALDKARNTLRKLSIKNVTHLSVAGSDRFATAVQASRMAYPDGLAPRGHRAVVIATGLDWPDALAGSALAGAADGPILFVSDVVPKVVLDEIKRLDAARAYVLGGRGAVSQGVVDSLTRAGLTVERFGGANRYATADAVAAKTIQLLEAGDGYNGTAFVATGASFADAMAAAPLAAARGWPIFLAHPRSGVQEHSRDELQDVTRAIVLGGTGAVSTQTQGTLAAKLRPGAYIQRLEGANRYETAAVVAQYGIDHLGLDWNGVGIATGLSFPDGLAGSVLQSNSDSVLLFTRSTLPTETAAVLGANRAAISSVTFFGGPAVTPPGVRVAVDRMLH